MDRNKFGEFIVQLRKEKNMTQVELASLLHISNKTVSKWETGRGLPDVSMLEPLANALDISVVELMKQERLDEDATFTKESVSKEVLNSLDYNKKTLAHKIDGFLGFCFSLSIYFMITGILMIFNEAYYTIAPFVGVVFLVKGVWNIQTGKDFALSLSLGILFITIPYLMSSLSLYYY